MQNSFNPNDVSILAKVIDQACLQLGCVEETEKNVIALRVLNYAAKGERDFDTLLSIALGGKAASHAT